ncbi:ATP-binding protein [Haloarchaeobius sp. TZWSO28]|uniref:ATP-binding protein n=1 Tax=Haloarchaeobius sp. TZWSO28 TaxID=3446119 RepID=UPI003EBE8617
MSDKFGKEVSENFASKLLLAESPSEVTDIVDELESNYTVNWRPLGQEQNNYGTVQTQASSPMPCFVELKANADDAVLIRGYEENKGKVGDPDEYPTMAEAAETFAPEDDDIEIIADGEIPTEGNTLNLSIRDKGCGQPPDRFEHTFLGLHTPGVIKQEYSFTQGQYGMGGTGVLQFCGDRHKGCYKFVASASHKQQGKWSWSLIRQNRDANQYEYIVVDDEIPGFDGTFGDCLVDRVPGAEPGDYGQEFGSFVKVYDYKLGVSKTDISGQGPFLYKFERYVVESPLQVSLTETRYESTSVNTNSTRGFLPSLNEDRFQYLVKDRETLNYDFTKVGSEILGQRDIKVILFKSDDQLEGEDTTSRAKRRFTQGESGHKDMTGSTGIHNQHAVMFTVNGQTHGDQGIGFLENQCSYSKVGKDTVVIVEFDDFANPDMSDLFKPTRDRLQDGKEETRCLKQGLKDALKQSDMLTDEEDRRRAKRGTSDAEFDTDSFEDFVKDHPEFASYVSSGQKISGPRLQPQSSSTGESKTDVSEAGTGEQGTIDESAKSPLKLPTYLTGINEYNPDGEHELWDESTSGTMQVSIPVNRRRKVRFETDAQDDYLTREILGGDLISSHTSMVYLTELHGGVLTLTIQPEEGAEPGENRMMTVRLTRPGIDDQSIQELDFNRIDGDREDILSSENPSLECYRALCPETIEKDSIDTVDTAPLYGHFEIQYIEEEESDENNTPSVSDDSQSASESDDGSEGETTQGRSTGGLDIPTVRYVFEEHWNFDPDADDFDKSDLEIEEGEFDYETAREFDESVIMRMDESLDGTISGLQITINMDSAPLRSFIVNKNIKETYKKYVETRYKNAVVFIVISQYRELKDQQEGTFNEKEISLTKVIENTVDGIGQVLMPMMFSENELERIAD